MPRLTKKTKGMPEGSGAPGGLAEAGHHAGPSYRTRAKMAGWAHGSCVREGVGRKTTNSSVDADGNESLEAEGHGNQMVLVQDPNRVRRVVGNDLILTDCSGHSREEQSTCSYFQDIPLIDKRSGLKICPLQQCYQDARREHSLEVPVRCSRTDKDAEQGQRIETTGKCGTDNCSGANVESVKVQQTPIMTLSIQKINSSDVWITRCVGQQPGQHHQGFGDARTSRTSTLLSVTEQDMPVSRVYSVDDMKVSDDRSHAIDSTLPPLPSFRDAFNPPYDMTKGYVDLVVEGKNSFESSSCRMNKNSPVFPVSSSCTVPMMSVNSVCTVPVLPISSVCPVPEVSVSTVCTAPFVTSASDCVDDKDTLVLLRNAAFESLSEAREMEPNIYVSYPRAQCKVTTVNSGSREISILNRQDSNLHVNNIVENCIVSDGNDSVINVIHSDFSHTSAHQVNPSSGLVKKVVWTAQNPRFAVTSILPSGKDSEGYVYSLQNDEIGNNVCAPLDVEQTESALREQEYLYVEANSIAHVDEDLSNDMCHSEADSGMLALDTMGSKYLAPGRDTILNENESYCTSGGTEDNFGTSCSKRVHYTKGQDFGEVRLLSQGENVSALPPTLADLMPEGDGELNDFTPSDQDYTLLPLWPFSGDEGGNHGSENEKPQVSGNVMKITCNDSTIACPKTTSSEDDNFNVGEINDLLDSLLHDIDKEKQRSHTEIEHPSYESTSEETTEYILRDTSRTRLGVGLGESESCPRPVLAHMEKDPTKDIIVASDALQYPPKPTPQSLKGNCLIPNHSIVGKVPHTVSFKTVPAVRTSASQNVASAHRLSEQLTTTTTTTTTTKWLQSQESINYVKILPKSSSNRCSTENQIEMSCHHPSALLSAPQTKSNCHVSNKKEMVLPVGETGINITIPKCTPVSIASFVLPKNHDQSTRAVSDHMWPGVKSCPEGENAILLQATNAPTTVKDELCLNVKNTDITPAITKLNKVPILASATTELMPLLSSVPLVLLAPVSEQPLMIHSISESSLVCNKNAPPVTNHGTQVTRKAGRKCCVRNAVGPFAMKSEKIKSAMYFPQINTASALGSSSVASSSTIQTMAPSQRSAETKTVANSQKHQPRKKPYSDSIKTKKLLQEDLKALLPDFSDSVLAILDLPPRAVHRGFFYMGEVKALHNQALSIQLEMLYRDHVRYCTSDTCIICVAFFDQKAALSEAKREVHVPEREKTGDKRKKQSRGKGRKSYDCEDEDELLFSSPSPQPLKKKNNKFDEYVHEKNVHLSNIRETNEIHLILPEKSSQVWGEARMKHSKSDSNVHKSASSQTEAIREHPRYSFDDSCHPPHCLSLTPSRTSTRQSLSPTLRRWKELAARKEVPQKTRYHTYSLRSDHWASLTRATLADLRLKQKLDRGNVYISLW
ncbi:hypothetical protein E2C01_003878 [Portunus trituberculatus]|uniref:Uncharacterized protein n=1 Tax=Portunus trituberculatus TaxID=210409 RepID=A0A5B7CNE7_PORTR|nr:hypothetical protein [Portunus trituberculatus]